MHFGTVGASAAPGTIVLDYLNGVTATDGAAVIDDAFAQTAIFTVTGEGSESFSIALTATSLTLTKVASTETLLVDGIECEQGLTSLLDGGTKLLYVKATLNVPADAVAGTYTNADELEVTVAYN